MVRDPAGIYFLKSKEKPSFGTETWLRRVGQERFGEWPAEDPAEARWLSCDSLGCLYRRNGQTVAFVDDVRSLAEDCAVASLVVSAEPVRLGRCRGPVIVDKFALWRGGAHGIWLRPEGPRIESVAGYQGVRPWSQHKGRSERPRARDQ
jgi:competence protein ComEC